MSESPTITSILAVPGVATTDRAENGSYPAKIPVFIGVEIDGVAITWGTCLIQLEDGSSGKAASTRVTGMVSTIKDIVAPALVGQELKRFRDLAPIIQTLKETTTVRIPHPPGEDPTPGISRREIISGFLAAPPQAVEDEPFEEREVRRRLLPSLRLGLSQALLVAVARVRNLNLVEVISQEFDLPLPTQSVDIQIAIRHGQTLGLPGELAAVSYAVDPTDPEKVLGPEGERIQRFVRQLRHRLDASSQDRSITIYLDMSGTLGHLFDDDMGKILGALYGLEQAAAPGSIYVQDPLNMADSDSQIKALVQLHSYLDMRKMSLKLVAGRAIGSLVDVNRYLEEPAAHMLLLDMARLGSIQETILASQACRKNGLEVLLAGPLADQTAQIALAIQPDCVIAPTEEPAGAGFHSLANEMIRTLTWLAKKSS